MPAILVENLVKRYGEVAALDGLSLEVDPGELFGVLGPNGAGKTTLINVLATLIRPTAGHAEVAGFDVRSNQDAVRRSIGVVFQDTTLDTKLTGRENLLFHAMMYGIPAAVHQPRIAELASLVELTDWLDARTGTYSGGMKRRLELARGLLHRPRVLLLDEPTLGLDVQTRRRIWGYVRRLNRDEGVTVILTTHYMEEADQLCQRVAIVDRGRLVVLDTPDRLKSRLGGDVLVLETAAEDQALAALLRATSWIVSVTQEESRLSLTMERAAQRLPEIIAIAREAGSTVRAVGTGTPSLEDVFLHFTGRSLRDAESDDDARLLLARQLGVRR